jgi:hypothetical protein
MSSSNPDNIRPMTKSGVPIPVPLTSPHSVAGDWWQIYKQADRLASWRKQTIYITTSDNFKEWNSSSYNSDYSSVEGPRTRRRWVLRFVDNTGTGTKNVACRTDEDVVVVMTVFKLTGVFEPVAPATPKKGAKRVVE